MENKSLSYRDAGVDIVAGEHLVQRIKTIAKRTTRPEVLGGLGGFAALFELPLDKYQRPVLVSGTDGVGTKLKLAMQLNKHDSIGIDLVAMCVNDLIVCGAEPLFFLDYYATGKLTVDTAEQVIKGIGAGCELAGAALVGGETAEMPGMYQGEDYDLAGFCVGIVEKSQIIDGTKVAVGDVLLGLASSGPHSNGYSLIRKILSDYQLDPHMPFGGSTLGEVLLEPTRIYVKPLLALLAEYPVHALAHITGGGFLENIPRVLPTGCDARIHKDSWTMPAIFKLLQETAHIADEEMYRTFNCGVGMVICVPHDHAPIIQHFLEQQGETVWQLGEIIANTQDAARPRVILK